MCGLECVVDYLYWIGCLIELFGLCLLEFEFLVDVVIEICIWFCNYVVKCLFFVYFVDEFGLCVCQECQVECVVDVCCKIGYELLFEVIVLVGMEICVDIVFSLMQCFYDLGVWFDWWKFELVDDFVIWVNIQQMILVNDLYCCGVVIFGFVVFDEVLLQFFVVVCVFFVVKGFVVGCMIWVEVVCVWFVGEIGDDVVLDMLVEWFGLFVCGWCVVCVGVVLEFVV